MTVEPEKGNLEGSGQLVILHFNLCHDNWNSIWQWFWPCLLVLLGWDFCWIIYTDGTRLIQHAQQKFLRGAPALGPTLMMLSNDFSVLSSVSKLICKRQLEGQFHIGFCVGFYNHSLAVSIIILLAFRTPLICISNQPVGNLHCILISACFTTI